MCLCISNLLLNKFLADDLRASVELKQHKQPPVFTFIALFKLRVKSIVYEKVLFRKECFDSDG
ncbi:MAG: hypothetical protein JWP88_14 [Flaviaesturariibacter sp.]|nr:hypothetical protein [Flaviaesturariibacter sp.]